MRNAISITYLVAGFRKVNISIGDLEDIVIAWLYFCSPLKEAAVNDPFGLDLPIYPKELLRYTDIDNFLEKYDIREEESKILLNFLISELYVSSTDTHAYDVNIIITKPDAENKKYVLKIIDKGDIYGIRYKQLLKHNKRLLKETK